MVSERLDQELGQREQLHPFTSLLFLLFLILQSLLTNKTLTKEGDVQSLLSLPSGQR